jgi:transposase InsO family protein
MEGRSSRPHRQPTKTPRPLVRKIVHARIKKRVGPVEIASLTGVPASTVHAVLVRCGLNRLSHVDVATGEPARRYEHPHPGSMIHVDVKKLGNIPDGGGWRYPGTATNAYHHPKLGHAYVHTVIDDHSHVAYAEIHDDETATTATGVLTRAVAWFAARGVRVESVLSDNGSAYRSHAWRDACRDLGIRHRRTRPYRPQTNGKIERFHRTMSNGWAYAKHYNSEHARRAALASWIHYYNHHRNHSAIGKVPPITRLNNLPGHYS